MQMKIKNPIHLHSFFFLNPCDELSLRHRLWLRNYPLNPSSETPPFLYINPTKKKMMSTASRLFSLVGASIFRYNTNLFPSSSYSSQTLRFHLYRSPSSFSFYSSAATVDSVSTHNRETSDSDSSSDSDADPPHPWPEWVTLVDRLNAKGYLVQTPSLLPTPVVVEDDGDGGGEIAMSDVISYKDLNTLQDACLSFAHERFDIFKSLPQKDIKTVVEAGCPNLFRKSVNSAKRLRAYLNLEEADVCAACNIRGSCDRAYVTLKEPGTPARTVDIVRIVLFYALDPLVIEGGEKPPGRQLVELSVRSLISNLIELSETTLDHTLPKPAGKVPQQKKQSTHDELSQEVEMKRGDWICPKCNFMNFSRNIQCIKCNEGGPKKVGADVEMKKGDWVCSECKFMNFSRNTRCLKCKANGPERVSVGDVEMKKGDWNCPKCEFMNFASNTKCLRCRGPRPKRELVPGDWECPKCDFVNYRRNMVCRKCDCERPKVAAAQYEDQLWRKPR
ncbi:zinc finger protein VAR3, chloroplastic-like [Cornus florida]|uniref:zinc finger protein VAR3, chloroplastic-like n=1 Tax=Cornus florida TaxID=4283 RepID=UPI00289A54F6|nr:zinc finger protein VAR3, chloroplastic-like [Cornus florida]